MLTGGMAPATLLLRVDERSQVCMYPLRPWLRDVQPDADRRPRSDCRMLVFAGRPGREARCVLGSDEVSLGDQRRMRGTFRDHPPLRGGSIAAPADHASVISGERGAVHGCMMFSSARVWDVLVAARADACLSPRSRFTPGSLQSPAG